MRSLFLPIVALLTFIGLPAWSQEAATPDPAVPAAAAPATGAAAPGAIALELNKLVPAEATCQAFFVVDNRTQSGLTELTVDAYFFDKEGVILRGLALQFADVRAGRATVAPFELPELPCADISRVLLNKVLTCTAAEGPVQGCADLLSVSTRAGIAFEY